MHQHVHHAWEVQCRLGGRAAGNNRHHDRQCNPTIKIFHAFQFLRGRRFRRCRCKVIAEGQMEVARGHPEFLREIRRNLCRWKNLSIFAPP